MILQLTNDTKSYSFEVNDLNYGEKLYYNFQIPTAEMEDGKYNMVLIDDNDVVVAEDVVCIGDFNSETIQYKRAENVYINTTLDANIEDVKEETIDNFETTIYPNDGYDAMKAVVVNAQPVYDNGYNEGETAQKAKLTGITITENGVFTREDGYNEITVDVPDLNGDYNEGYDAGKVDGYDSGYTAGEVEQKSKLTNITISENGTYTREDGYNTVVVNVEDTNGSYDEGYQAGIDYASENAEEIAAANAIDLVATDFGIYYTKYSDNIAYPDQVTGVFPNGDIFHNYAYTDKIYDTGIIPNANSEIELWFKPDATGGTWGCIISAGYQDTDKYTIRIRRLSNDNIYIANFGTGQGHTENNSDDLSFELKNNIFNHIKFSANGLYVNGVLYNNFDGDFTPQGTFVIDGFNSDSWATGETGYYGMIKITTDGVENVIIPTQDGFMNITTNTILPQILTNIGSRYEYIDSTPIVLDNLIKSVNVQPKIDVTKYNIKLGYSTFTEVPDFYDFSNTTNMENMFANCGILQTIPRGINGNIVTNWKYFMANTNIKSIEPIDISLCKNLNNMFESTKLTELPYMDTSNATYMIGFLANNSAIMTIPEFNTRRVENMSNFFYNFSGNKNLVSLPKIYCDSCTNMGSYFSYYADGTSSLTDVGGWINLKCNWDDRYGLASCPNLTYQSCINVLNGLYDFVGNGETPTSSQGKLKVHPNFLTTVGDEISIGSDKGWTITA